MFPGFAFCQFVLFSYLSKSCDHKLSCHLYRSSTSGPFQHEDKRQRVSLKTRKSELSSTKGRELDLKAPRTPTNLSTISDLRPRQNNNNTTLPASLDGFMDIVRRIDITVIV